MPQKFKQFFTSLSGISSSWRLRLPKNSEPGTRFPRNSDPGTRLPKNSEPGTRLPKNSEPGTLLPKNSDPGTRLPKNSDPGTRLPKILIRVHVYCSATNKVLLQLFYCRMAKSRI